MLATASFSRIMWLMQENVTLRMQTKKDWLHAALIGAAMGAIWYLPYYLGMIGRLHVFETSPIGSGWSDYFFFTLIFSSSFGYVFRPLFGDALVVGWIGTVFAFSLLSVVFHLIFRKAMK